MPVERDMTKESFPGRTYCRATLHMVRHAPARRRGGHRWVGVLVKVVGGPNEVVEVILTRPTWLPNLIGEEATVAGV